MIYLVGGGPSTQLGRVDDEFVAHAKRRGNRVLVCLLADMDEWAGQFIDPITSRWPEVKIEHVKLLVNPETLEDSTQWPDNLEDIAGIVVGGGWTPGYLAALASKRDLIARLVRRDVPYLGFSAGSMIASRHALVGGWKHNGQPVVPEVNAEGLEELTLRDGLALITPMVQTHFGAWGNEGAVTTAIEQRWVSDGLAIDEDTCLNIDPINGRTRVLGAGRVRWFSREPGGVFVRTEAAAAGSTPIVGAGQ